MYSLPLPWLDARLALSLPWTNLPVIYQVPLLVLVCLVPVTLAVWLYRYEMRLVRGRTAVALLLLRLVTLFVILFLVCLQPIVAHPYTEELTSQVLIAVDRSDSMNIADPQRDPIEKLRLARALRMGDPALLNDWIHQYETQGSIQWVQADESPRDPDRRRQLREQRQQAHDALCQQIDHLTRTQVARTILSDEGLGLVRALQSKHHVQLVGFAQDSWQVDPKQLDQLFQDVRPMSAIDQPHHTRFTDLRLPVTKARERSGERQSKRIGVVLLTDGQHNWGESPLALFGKRGGAPGANAIATENHIPIYPVVLGDRKAPPDVAIARVEAPATVFKDGNAPIDVTIQVNGMEKEDLAEPLVVELRQGDEPIMEEQVMVQGQSASVKFSPRLDTAGTQSFLVTVKPLPKETITENNHRPVVINVADDQAKVLVVDGEARWEFHYLFNALKRDRSLQTRGVVFEQPRIRAISEDELEKTGHPALMLPHEEDALADYDGIVLGDVAPAHLLPQDRRRLEKFVAERGGTLILVAGKRWLPLAYRDAAPGDEQETDPLRNLLPIEHPRPITLPQGFPITLTHDGKQTSFLRMEATLEDSLDRWSKLPRHYWGVVGVAKPGATVLGYVAEAPEGLLFSDQSMIEKEQALIVRQNYGFGRVVYVGVDSTWRWRYKKGDEYHHKFWGQLARWAASNKPLVAGNEFIRFGTREPVYAHGQDQPVEVVARLTDDSIQLGPHAVTAARILRWGDDGQPSEAVAVVPLQRRAAQPRVLEAQVRDLPPGRYVVELAIPDLADKLHGVPDPGGTVKPLRATFSVTPPDSTEMLELAANWTLLRQLAQASQDNPETHAKLFTPENVLELIELLQSKTETVERTVDNKLWHSWFTFILFLGLLTVEWVARKLSGLP
ncbi:MAG: hypothetical protein ACK4RK_18260 [Gemmataceae bacterium]